jgi:hypothetical protein
LITHGHRPFGLDSPKLDLSAAWKTAFGGMTADAPTAMRPPNALNVRFS